MNPDLASAGNAQSILTDLASLYLQPSAADTGPASIAGELSPSLEARHKVLLDQIPAVVFMASSQREWLEDPVRWYRQIHDDDKDRWSIEAAEMFLSVKPLRSACRVMTRDGRVVGFHCEARLVRRNDGKP